MDEIKRYLKTVSFSCYRDNSKNREHSSAEDPTHHFIMLHTFYCLNRIIFLSAVIIVMDRSITFTEILNIIITIIVNITE